MEQATFGAGCFWGAEAFFREIDGVIDTRVGHSSGTDGSTTAARIEVVQIDFDPQVLSYDALIRFFWDSHDPTSLDRQGEETGEGVRSAIFVHSSAQANEAGRLRDVFNATSLKPATTQIIPFKGLEIADEKQQRYLEKNSAATCSVNI
ncbi:peptide-methionine (S)-S-oxide reductase MsrA [Brucella sp. NBRC 12950]|jgi:peptide-methionine (S)-S-oxide reductase|uniref:peptide-methionine (S)-S-oxide reductase MsrA n=1 Tax=Brucella sp. NBRC 12950 TaxID=2994518 RepID=UPI0024A150C0|nr:peptide-methionine (S)-S-oxide reductase MsrA [Brucella sp. NBRC 12950]GLU27398.1 peptide methionine sulfoxide reductase MsrA [Brucella sp. NBRC 12950]